MKGFNIRKWWYFENNRCLRLEFSGWHFSPDISFSVDTGEAEVQFSFNFGLALYITFEGFLPEAWYPKPKPGEWSMFPVREISFSFHNYSFWWNIWKDPDDMCNHPNSWRMGVFNFADFFMGKHSVRWDEIGREEFFLPFSEGNYPVQVAKRVRVDSWQRWFDRKSISFEVTVGYYHPDTKEFVEMCVPHEGKGENRWDCDEDGTFSSTFPGKEFDLCFDGALYFWKSEMQTREHRGGKNWIPKAYKREDIKVILTPPRTEHKPHTNPGSQAKASES